jgi:folate-binding protein YgfZ
MTATGYDAVGRSAGLVDRSDRALVRVTGADRASWLQGLLTNDVAALSPGRGCYAALLTPQGRMLADLRVFDLGDRMLLDVPAEVKAGLLERLETFVITEDVQVDDPGPTIDRVSIHGPVAASMLAGVTDWREPGGEPPIADLAARLTALPEDATIRVEAWGQEVIVAGSRECGVTGLDVHAPFEVAARLREALVQAGAGVVSQDAWTARRIEAGRPLFGADMTGDTIPLEAGIESRAISFTKGCYVGQEVIVRVRDRGHGRVARRLVGLSATRAAIARSAAVAPGDPLRAGEKDVGRVTSAAWSPAVGTTIALGYVHRDFVEPGTHVDAVHGEHIVAFVVTPTPFPRQPGSEAG